MANRTDSRRLDELVKQTLSNYESATPVSDWQKMESMLGTAPKIAGSAFKFPSLSLAGAAFVKSIFSSYIFIVVLMLAGGGYLLYTILKAPKQDTALTTALPADTVVSTPTVTPAVISDTVHAQNTSASEIKPEIIKDTVAAVETEPVKTETEEVKSGKKEIEDKKDTEPTVKKDEKKEKKAEKSEAEKSEAEKLKEKKREEKKEEAKKAEKKEKDRIAKEEKEKNATPKETLKKSNNPVGLNFLRSVNLDSLKKQQEQPPLQPQQTKDSVKTP